MNIKTYEFLSYFSYAWSILVAVIQRYVVRKGGWIKRRVHILFFSGRSRRGVESCR